MRSLGNRMSMIICNVMAQACKLSCRYCSEGSSLGGAKKSKNSKLFLKIEEIYFTSAVLSLPK